MICRVCDATTLTPVLDLGLQPWGNHFLKPEEVGAEPKYPLRLVFCEECSCVQLDYTVPKEVMFTDHTYVSGTTKTLAGHFQSLAQDIDNRFFSQRSQKSVLDIGSNDGTQLKAYRDLGFSCLGVESCRRVAEMAHTEQIATDVAFFNDEWVQKTKRKFDVVNASGVFFHLEELHSAARGVANALLSDGVFVVQFLYMKSIVENLAFDQIYHEHLLYYTLRTIRRLLERHGLAPFDAWLAPIHGGSMILLAGHPGSHQPTERLIKLERQEDAAGANTREWYERFAERVANMRTETLRYLDEAKADGKLIYGFGAPVKGNTFLNYCGIGTQYIDALVEKNPLRKGLVSPGMHIPIILEHEVTIQPDIYFVLAWNFRDEILRNNKRLMDEGVEFYFPVIPSGEKSE